MNPSIRSVPDLPITDLLARAFGVRPTCYASMRGDSCEIRLDSGASLTIECHNGGLETSVRLPSRTLDSLDELREHQRDVEVLARWADFVTIYAQHRMMRADISKLAEIVERSGIDDSDQDFIRAVGDLAAAQEIGLDDDSFEEAVEGFVSLALTLRELDAMAATMEHHLPAVVQIDMPAMSLCGESLHAGV